MLSKEEILNKHDTSRKYIEQTCRPELFAAMDEFARQEIVAFEKWKLDNSIEFKYNYGEMYYQATAGEPLPINPRSPTELYLLYWQIKPPC